MDKFREMSYTIDGIKSDIHCIYLDINNIEWANEYFYHHHDYIELLYSISTDAQVCINEKYHKFTDGDLVIINSEDPHRVIHGSFSKYIVIKFSPYILYSSSHPLFESRYVIPFNSGNYLENFYSDREIADTQIADLLFEIMEEWDKKEIGYELFIRGNIQKIFGIIFRIMNNKGLNVQQTPLSDVMKKALEHVSINYSTTTEIETAKVCGMSYTHFSRTFKSEFKQTFNEYLLFIKLKEAEKMLLSTDKSITEIAIESGFSSSSHFISLFKKNKDITPKQYRKKICQL